MDHLAGKACTKHPTKVPIGSGSTYANKISPEHSMESRPEGPHNIPSDIGCVLGLELAAKTSERFSGGRTQPYLKWGKRPHRSISHAPRRVCPKIAPVMEECCSLLQCSMLGTGGTCECSHRNSRDRLRLWVLVFLPQLFARHKRGCNLHNLQNLCTLFPQPLLICHQLPTRLDDKIIKKTRNTVRLQLCVVMQRCTTLEKGGGG